MATTILDVSTREKFRKSYIKGTKNIPYDEVKSNLEEIKNMQPLIVCCSTGELSKWAYNFLKEKGIEEVHNGGNWETVAFMIKNLQK
jgi:phage shock protein E